MAIRSLLLAALGGCAAFRTERTSGLNVALEPLLDRTGFEVSIDCPADTWCAFSLLHDSNTDSGVGTVRCLGDSCGYAAVAPGGDLAGAVAATRFTPISPTAAAATAEGTIFTFNTTSLLAAGADAEWGFELHSLAWATGPADAPQAQENATTASTALLAASGVIVVDMKTVDAYGHFAGGGSKEAFAKAHACFVAVLVFAALMRRGGCFATSRSCVGRWLVAKGWGVVPAAALAGYGVYIWATSALHAMWYYAMGLCATAMLSLILLTASGASSPLAWAAALPHERVVECHKLLGRAFCAAAALHGIPYFYYPSWGVYMTVSKWYWFGPVVPVAGFVAFIAVVLGMLASIGFVRRAAYHIFLWSHWLMTPLVVGGTIAHAPSTWVWFAPGLLCLAVHALRVACTPRCVITSLKTTPSGKYGRVVLAGGDVTKGVPMLGATARVQLGTSLVAPTHPLSIVASTAEQGTVLCIKAGAAQRASAAFLRQRRQGDTVRMGIVGGGAAIDLESYSRIVLVGGGVGVTPLVGALHCLARTVPAPAPSSALPSAPASPDSTGLRSALSSAALSSADAAPARHGLSQANAMTYGTADGADSDNATAHSACRPCIELHWAVRDAELVDLLGNDIMSAAAAVGCRVTVYLTGGLDAEAPAPTLPGADVVQERPDVAAILAVTAPTVEAPRRILLGGCCTGPYPVGHGWGKAGTAGATGVFTCGPTGLVAAVKRAAEKAEEKGAVDVHAELFEM